MFVWTSVSPVHTTYSEIQKKTSNSSKHLPSLEVRSAFYKHFTSALASSIISLSCSAKSEQVPSLRTNHRFSGQAASSWASLSLTHLGIRLMELPRKPTNTTKVQQQLTRRFILRDTVQIENLQGLSCLVTFKTLDQSYVGKKTWIGWSCIYPNSLSLGTPIGHYRSLWQFRNIAGTLQIEWELTKKYSYEYSAAWSCCSIK